MATATSKRIRPPIKRHGGKHFLARRIVALMPEHHAYIEPFIGGGSVLLNKPPAEVEIGADLDPGLIGMWRALARYPSLVADCLDSIPYSDAMFGWAIQRCGEAVIHEVPAFASAYIVRSRFSRGGLGKTFAWSDRLRGGQPGDANAWDTFRRVDLPLICERVRGVEFHHRPALDLIGEWQGRADCLMYLDPPYLHATRTKRDAYEFEMDDAAHRALLDLIAGAYTAARVMLSGYANPLYDAALAGWRRVTFDMPNHSSQARAKQRRTEVLWMNF